MHRGGRKLKLFSAGSGFKGQIFKGDLSGVDSLFTFCHRDCQNIFLLGKISLTKQFNLIVFRAVTNTLKKLRVDRTWHFPHK